MPIGKREGVMLYKDARELIDNEFPLETRSFFHPIIESVYMVYNEWMEEPAYKCPMFDSIRTRLLTSLVESQFTAEKLIKHFPLESSIFEKNSFGLKGVNLTSKNARLNIARVQKSNQLPPATRYRKEYAESNSFIENQVKMTLDPEKPFGYKPYYAIITYGGVGKLDFLKLIIPNQYITEMCYVIDLFKEAQEERTPKLTEVRKQKLMLELREEVNKKLSEVN